MLARQLSRGLSRQLSIDLDGITRKVLIDFDSTANAFCSIGTDVVLVAAYKLGLSAVLPVAATTYALYGRASSATDYLKLLSSGYLSLDVNGTVVTSTVLATKDSKYREYSVTLDGNDFVFRENTAIISTVTNATAAAKTLTLNLIANSNGANFYSGIAADAVMGSLRFSINQLIKEYELPVSNVFGSEEITNNTFENTTGWAPARAQSVLSVVSNKLRATISSTSTFGSSFLMNGLVIGETYSFIASAVSNNAGATVRLRIATDEGLGSTIVNEDASGSVAIDTVFIATATTMYVGTIVTGQDSGDYVDIEAGISIKSVTNYITYQNIALNKRDTYELSSDGTKWVSPTRTIDIAAQA